MKRAVEVLSSHAGKAGHAGKASAQSASREFGGPADRRFFGASVAQTD